MIEFFQEESHFIFRFKYRLRISRKQLVGIRHDQNQNNAKVSPLLQIRSQSCDMSGINPVSFVDIWMMKKVKSDRQIFLNHAAEELDGKEETK